MLDGPEASTGFSLSELLFDRKPQLDLIKKNCEEDPSSGKNDIESKAWGESWENLLQALELAQRLYDKGGRLGQFSPGDITASSSSIHLAKCQGSLW